MGWPVASGAQTRVDLRTQSKGVDVAGHVEETGNPHTVSGVAGSSRQGDGNKFQMAGGNIRAGGVVVYDAAGNVIASDCNVGDGVLSCGAGEWISTIMLPELGTNGENVFVIHGAPEQLEDGCIVLRGQPAEGQALRATGATMLDDDGRTCVLMEWAAPLGNLAEIPTRRYADLQEIPATFPPSAHGASHRHGGADEVGTPVPAPYGVPKAGITGTLDPGWLPGPGPATKGGVQAKDCSAGSEFVQSINADGSVTCAAPSAGDGGGGVWSVGLTMPPQFSVSGSPITGSGTIAVTALNQAANTVLAGPPSGGAGGPAYRLLSYADLPAIPFFQSCQSRAGTWSVSVPNQIRLYGFFIQYPVVFSRIMYSVTTTDTTGCEGSGCRYDVGIFDANGALLAATGPQYLTAIGDQDFLIAGGGSVRLDPGKYYWAITGTGTEARIAQAGSTSYLQFCNNVYAGQSSDGTLPFSITPPPDVYTSTGVYPFFALR